MAIVSGSKVETGLPQVPEGVPPELFSYFFAIYNAVHNLERMLSQYAGIDEQPVDYWNQLTVDDTILDGNLNRWYVKANEILTFGEAVSPILVGSELQVRRANATNNTKWCCGFVSNIDGAPGAGSFVEVRTRGIMNGISGMTAGSRYWLSTSSGQITNVAPAASGNIQQVVGFALAPNRLLCNLDSYFVTVP